MKTLDEDEFTVEKVEENYESNVPIFNKFEALQNLKCDTCADKPVEQEDCWSQTAGLECIVCGVFFLSEANLNDHMKRNHKLTLESPTQTSTPSMISKFQQTIEIKKTVKNKEEEISDKFEKYPCLYCDKEIVSWLQAL